MPEIKNLFVKKGSIFTRIPLSTIYWMEARGRKVYIHTDHGIFTSNSSIKKVNEILMNTHLVRVHKSFMVNINKILVIKNGQVILEDDKAVFIGRTYMTDFKELIYNLQI